MPRYYIDVRSRFGTDEDLEGIDLPDIAAARAQALKAWQRVLDGCSGTPPEARRDIVVEVVDETSRTVLMIPYSEIEERFGIADRSPVSARAGILSRTWRAVVKMLTVGRRRTKP